MGNLSIVPAVPAADGAGAGSSVAALGLEKTIYVDGTFTGSVIVEMMCGQGFVPVAVFTAPGRQTVKMAAEEMRVVRASTSAVPGTPAVTISGNDDGAQFLDIPLGSPGASVDTKAFGVVNTLVVDGDIDGVVHIQTSEDDVTWTDLCTFQTPGHKTLEITARYVRSNHVNNVLASTPQVSIGAVNDDTAHRPINALVSGANVAWDAGLGDKAALVLGENLTIDNPTNCEAGMVLEIALEQSTGGHTGTWGSAWEWPGGTPPVLSVGAGAVDKVRGFVHTVDANGVATSILAEFALAFA